jgi:hypothetical protein
MEYCFGNHYNYCESENFTSNFMVAVAELLDTVHWTMAFPFLATVMNATLTLPHWVLMKMVPERTKSILVWLEVSGSHLLDRKYTNCRCMKGSSSGAKKGHDGD